MGRREQREHEEFQLELVLAAGGAGGPFVLAGAVGPAG